MARKLKTKVRILIECVEESTDLGAGELPSRLVHRFEYNRDFSSGTANGTQLDRVHSSTADYTTSPTDVDIISPSSLPSRLDGQNVSIADLCIVAASNTGTVGDLELFGDTAGVVGVLKAANDVAMVKPGGCFVWVAPNGITPIATTGDIIQLVATAGTIEGKSLIAGRSA